MVERFDHPSFVNGDASRVASEGLAVVSGLMSGEPFLFAGKHFTVTLTQGSGQVIGAPPGRLRIAVSRKLPPGLIAKLSDDQRGAWGVGSVHHLAWRVDDEEHQLAMRSRVLSAGGSRCRWTSQ